MLLAGLKGHRDLAAVLVRREVLHTIAGPALEVVPTPDFHRLEVLLHEQTPAASHKHRTAEANRNNEITRMRRYRQRVASVSGQRQVGHSLERFKYGTMQSVQKRCPF